MDNRENNININETGNNTNINTKEKEQNINTVPAWKNPALGATDFVGVPDDIIEPKPKQDTLKLEYPAFADKIDNALQKGYNRNDLRKKLAIAESVALMQYSQKEVNKYLGRDFDSVRKTVDAIREQEDNSYVQIMKYDMTEKQVRDILWTAHESGIAPGVLLMNPELLPSAEKLAGERRNFFGTMFAAAKNAVANVQENNVSTYAMYIAQINEVLNNDNNDEELKNEGLRYLNDTANSFSDVNFSDDDLRELGRKSYERQIKQYQEMMKTDSEDAKKWRTSVRTPENAFAGMLFKAIENSGFTVKSAVRSGIAWSLGALLGGPLGAMSTGTLMSLYNTVDEADTEAGSTFRDAIIKGMSTEEALKRAKEVKINNLLLLPLTNFGGDYLLFAPSKYFKKLAEKTVTGSMFRDTLARGVLRFGFPTVLESVPEGVEEFMQELFQMNALGEPLDQNRLWEAAKTGFLNSIIYSVFGLGTRGAFSRLTGQNQNQAQEILSQYVKEFTDLTRQIQNGEIQKDDVVEQEPIIFLPKSKINEQTAEKLGIQTHKYVINENEAKIIKIIFDKYAHDVGYNQILSYLNGMGYRTKRGKLFGKNSLYSILQKKIRW